MIRVMSLKILYLYQFSLLIETFNPSIAKHPPQTQKRDCNMEHSVKGNRV